MGRYISYTIGLALLIAIGSLLIQYGSSRDAVQIPDDREEVVFWHFWGGEDRDVVDDVVRRFNESQSEYFVRAIAMPGNNLQAKLFLSVAGGDPPDIINQDDPVVPDWAHRGVIDSLEQVAPAEEVAAVRDFLLPAAEKLSTYEGEMFALCNGLDIRALYYNQTLLDKYGLEPPETTNDLDRIAEAIAPQGSGDVQRYGYLPDTRRLWAWGYVFGGSFYDDVDHQATIDSPAVDAALKWMASYRDKYSADRIAAFRTGDQSLPGKTFPLLPIRDDEMFGRYAVVMDGQWQVRKILALQQRREAEGLPAPSFGVCPLPIPAELPPGVTARSNAGWVNGNFFVFPRNARNRSGAWEFAKFWIGYQSTDQAAKTCIEGGWIPVSQSVVESPEFKKYTDANPLFGKFVELASSPNQFPTPPVVGAAMFKRAVESASYDAMFTDKPIEEILQSTNQTIQQQLDRQQRRLEEAPKATR
ncbi:MAG: extracellular solute-binding protein [Planctomycetota bacterium]